MVPPLENPHWVEKLASAESPRDPRVMIDEDLTTETQRTLRFLSDLCGSVVNRFPTT
jgi:hypothetical protein